MITETRIESFFDPSTKILTTHLNGAVSLADVEEWITSYHKALKQIPPYTNFKVLVDLNGFKADNFETHKKMRTVVPASLAQYGHMVGYIKLFEPNGISTSVTEGKKCIAAAHVHHDETKISLYQNTYAGANEFFTTDYLKAEEWINRYEQSKTDKALA